MYFFRLGVASANSIAFLQFEVLHCSAAPPPLAFFCLRVAVGCFAFFCSAQRGVPQRGGLCPNPGKKMGKALRVAEPHAEKKAGQKGAERQKEAVQMVQKGGFVMQKSHVFKKF